MNVRLVLSLLGKAMMVEGALIVPSIIVAVIYGGGDWQALGMAAALAAVLGLLLSRIARPSNKNLRAREGFVSVALIWMAMSFLGALPFYFDGSIPSLTDSFFESVSGFTTTGSTILTDVEVLPKGLMFWRSFTHWVGGMGVLVLSLALLPDMGARTAYLLKAESTGPAPGKLVPRIGNSARLLYRLYMLLTLLQLIALLVCGMNLYDALIHTFGSAGTGGFSNYADSVAHFGSPAVDAVLATFMLLFGINFSMYYFVMHRHFKLIVKNEELRMYFAAVLISVIVIALNILPGVGGIWEALRQSYFQVSSIVTTTGYSTVDFNRWPELSRWILVLLMLVGSCAGSTAGGLKMVRVTLLFKAIRREINRMMHPRSVTVIKMDGRVVEEGIVSQVAVFFFMYLLIIGVATLIVSLDGFGLETNLTAVIATVSNIGPGLGMVGPMGSFAQYSPASKWVLSICMLVGRLEIYPFLMLVVPATWKRG